ncbi:class I SAM-dependent methyltransferase [Algiphilus sp.]|uniref:class I SAM-dependent methyltransferase n=1 Tax=Algiphilus sp. TaxID=1872431 RepID=UPI002A5F19C8|nr:class I SAM-dependent methyltransferase [Pseudomonadota bacterium]
MKPDVSPLDNQSHQSSWEHNAASWITAVRARALPSRRITDEALVSRIGTRPWRALLDLGCGEGWLLRRLSAAPGARLCGVDGCAALIDAARAAHPEASYFCSGYAALVQRDPLAEQRYDWVVLNFALFGAAEDEMALRFALEHLSPTGRVLIQTLPAAAELRAQCETFAGLPGQWTPMPYRLRSVPDWQALARAAGATECDVTTVYDDQHNPLSLLLELRP